MTDSLLTRLETPDVPALSNAAALVFRGGQETVGHLQLSALELPQLGHFLSRASVHHRAVYVGGHLVHLLSGTCGVEGQSATVHRRATDVI